MIDTPNAGIGRVTPLIGAHCGGGIGAAAHKALEIGAECLQVFASAPQMWRSPNLKDKDVDAFAATCTDRGVGPIFLHGIYLMNLASARPDIYEKSIEATVVHLAAADRLCADGLVIHLGSATGSSYADAEDRVVAGLERALAATDGGQSRLLLETCAGQGNTIGRTTAELGAIINRLGGHRRLGVCLDTCHVYAAGYDIKTAEGRERLLDEFSKDIGLDRLKLIHANDSKGALGSNVDRHDNIGSGHLGEETFAALMADRRLRSVPFVMEVPGVDGSGPDAHNIATMRRLRGDVDGSIASLPVATADGESRR